MGSRINTVDKRIIVSPQAYNIPSKVVEGQGATMGIKLKGSMDTNSISPGPGTYVAEKVINNNLTYSMGAKLENAKAMEVPGPGAYTATLSHKSSVKNVKFGSG